MNGDDFADSSAEREFERELLASAASDRVGNEAVRAAWSRFALTAGATAALANAATHGAVASRMAAGRGVLRWVSLGALGGGAVTAALMAVLVPRTLAPAGATARAAVTATATPTPTGAVTAMSGASAATDAVATAAQASPSARGSARAEPPVAERAAPRIPAAAATPKRHAAPRSREVPAGAPAARPNPSSSLAAEIALLDEARRAQNAGQFEYALDVLARYQREHPRGELRRESDVLKLETLSRLGERNEAADLARHFLQAFPDDPHATFVRTFAE